MTKSKRSATSRKATARTAKLKRPNKPYDSFPLFFHALGYISKKILGRVHHFGRWARVVDGRLTPVEDFQSAWTDALRLYEVQAPDLHAGRDPKRTAAGAVTVGAVCNAFLEAKQARVRSGEIGGRTFAEYKAATDLIVDEFGAKTAVESLTPEAFGRLRSRMADGWGPVRLGNVVGRVRTMFRFAFRDGLIPVPVRYGDRFDKPSRAVLRKHKATRPAKDFSAPEIRAMLAAADPTMRAAILMGINLGYGNAEAASVPLRVFDLDGGWASYPRPKSGVDRRMKMWDETVAAVRAVLAGRRVGPDDRVLVNRNGGPMLRAADEWRIDGIADGFKTLMKKCGIPNGRGFYGLRHSFETQADAARDPVAVNLAMGHADDSMAGNYRARIDDSRLAAVARTVHDWLFGTEGGAR